MRPLPKITFQNVRVLIFVLLIAIFSFGGGFVTGSGSSIKDLPEVIKVNLTRDLPANHSTLNFSLFWKVWDTVSESYYDKSKVVESEMVYGAIKGLVSALGDPYTVFLPPDENKVVEEDLQGTFSGVGIQIGFRGTRLAVIAPLPGSPAEKAGVKAGDFIVGIKDEAKKIDRGTEGMTLPEAVEAIRGTAKTKVTLALLREGANAPYVIEVERETIDVPSVVLTFEGENKDIALIKVLKFSAETTGEWNKKINEVAGKNVKGIIVDMRNNPGGYLGAAVDLASEFLETGSTVVIEEGKGGFRKEDKVERVGRLIDRKVVVLINKGSASASEIFSGALRDVAGVKLVGDVSFGKGTVQEPIQINGAGLHITTSKWLTPSGYWVHEKGLEPDIKVEDKADTPQDEQLDEAIKSLK